ncbi:putative deoxyribonuclease TATDN2 [Acanthaster planci]|uniref:Deoxyribonuclease TATDN2 n=1 Tax=Acanthaster planci TaxID=133434 RepID=A0A8B7ZUG1_ACAPL|nr:putative deoxyribonuclease TATDN2 [Acanthaster planci]
MGNLTDFLLDEEINTVNFRGCIANFCDENTLADEKRWEELINDKFVFPAVSLHPRHTHHFTLDTIRVIRYLLGHPKTCALGEVGLDYSRGQGKFKVVQESVLQRLLGVAIEFQKPVVLHCRDVDEESKDAEDDCLQIVSEVLPPHWKIHPHCHTNSWKRARNWCRRFPNLCIGLTPIVQWDAPGPKEVARRIPLGCLLLETNAPFFKPRWSPRTVEFSNSTDAKLVAHEIARIIRIQVEDVLRECLQNTTRIYAISM